MTQMMVQPFRSWLAGTCRDYVTYMLTLVVLYLTFPAITMLSCYDSIYKHFKKIHHHRVSFQQVGLYFCNKDLSKTTEVCARCCILSLCIE